VGCNPDCCLPVECGGGDSAQVDAPLRNWCWGQAWRVHCGPGRGSPVKERSHRVAQGERNPSHCFSFFRGGARPTRIEM